MFRERMRVSVSNAEVEVMRELQRRGLSRGMATQEGFEFGGGDGVRGTTIDFYWDERRLAVFLDGPHHLKERQGEKDELIDRALARRGVVARRFPYRVPLTKRRLGEICDSIEGELARK